jgi:MFS family permease
MAAAVFLPLSYGLSNDAFIAWGWRVPFLLSVLVLVAGYIIRREVDETPAFTEERGHGDVPRAPVLDALTNHWPDMLRIVCMALMNVIPVVATIFGAAYAVQPAYGVGMDKTVYLWIPVIGNIVAVVVIPFVGDLSDRIGRRTPIIVGSIAAGLMTFVYLYAISIKNVPLAFVLSILMWGIVYQGYNAVYPSFYPELFPTRARVSGMAISQNIGTMLTAFVAGGLRRSRASGLRQRANDGGRLGLCRDCYRLDRLLDCARNLPHPSQRPWRTGCAASRQERVRSVAPSKALLR